MSFSNQELLKHIDDEITFILKVVDKKTKEEVIDDEVLCRAIVRSIEIIGEAAKKVEPHFKVKHSDIEWKKMAGTRDKLIHDYFGVDYDIIWDIIKNKLPKMQMSIATILNKNIGYSRTISSNILRENTSQTLRRYFLLAFTFNFSKNPGGAAASNP